MKSAILLPVLLLVIQPFFSLCAAPTNTAVVSGHVVDAADMKPLPRVTVHVEGTGSSTLTNDDGFFSLRLEQGNYRLKFSHVSHYTEWKAIDVTGDSLTLDVKMRTAVVDIGEIKVYDRAYDPAQRIIVEAIRRKKDILSHIHDYRYDAYARFVLRDRSKPDSNNIFLIAESQTSAFWEQPDKYKEIVRARKQTANIKPGDVIEVVGEFLNFNKNRIELGDYLLVTPTATDALDYYDYYLIDTVYRGKERIFRLELEPKNRQLPLFTGYIQIVDSTFDVVAVDMGLSKGVHFSFVSNLQYSQRFELFEQEYWMPVEIRLTGDVDLGVPFPGVPRHLAFTDVALLHDFVFEEGETAGRFDEFTLEVSEDADDVDSAAWFARPTIPLSITEATAYQRIDSVERQPQPIARRLVKVAMAIPFLLAGGADRFFHFNRVEGAYLGAGIHLPEPLLGGSLDLRFGRALEGDYWQHQYGINLSLWKRRRMRFHAEYRDRIVRTPSAMTSTNESTTLEALAFGIDPFDYYLERGWKFSVSSAIIKHFTAQAGYSDFLQISTPVHTNYSLFNRNEPVRYNPAISDGVLRAIDLSIRYDSRRLIKNKGQVIHMGESQFTLAGTGIQYASPRFLTNDFDYRRYYVWLLRRQRLFGLGISSVYLFAGSSDGALPPQRYFRIDFGNGVLYESRGFNTVAQNNFYGNRAAVIYVHHDLDNLLFGRSGLPLLSRLPFTSSVFGGAFWSDFAGEKHFAGYRALRTAPTAYSELGFGIANLTPFLSPLNLAAYFTWQLSAYDTDRFQFNLGIEL